MKRKLLILLIGAGSVLFTACAGGDNENNASSNADSNNNGNNNAVHETEGEQQDLTVGLAGDPVSLDPHAANDGISLYVMNGIYDTLVELNTDLEIQPSLAESLEPIEETVWEAKLREDVVFHDGSEFNAEVVKANLDRVLDPEVGSPLSFLFNMIESVEVVDDYTVHITTEFPFSALPSHLAHPGGHMISLESIEADYEAMENGDGALTVVNENPVGTGYFKYEERVNGEYTKLVKNEDYWGNEAQVESVTFKVVPEDLTRMGELQTGASDIVYPVNANDMSEINAHDETFVNESESASMAYVGMNVEREPFNNTEVRQAIALAINKDDIIQGALDGVGLQAKGPLAPTVFGYHEGIEEIEHDLERANELMEEAGFGDGFSAAILTYDRNTTNIAELIQAQLGEIGIDLSIETTEIGTYLEMTGNGEADMYVGSWGTVTLDGDYGLYPMFHSDNAGNPGNRSFYANDEVDALLEQARQSTDESERLELYAEAQQIIVDEAPIVPLYHSVLLAGLRENVNGFFQYPSSFPFLRDVTVE